MESGNTHNQKIVFGRDFSDQMSIHFGEHSRRSLPRGEKKQGDLDDAQEIPAICTYLRGNQVERTLLNF